MRREFPRSVRVAVIKRATKDGVIYCEKCSGIARKFQIDHIIADACGGEPVLSNAQLICEACFSVKNPQDTTKAAKIKRVEAKHLGAVRPKQKIRSAGFPVRPKIEKLPLPRWHDGRDR